MHISFHLHNAAHTYRSDWMARIFADADEATADIFDGDPITAVDFRCCLLWSDIVPMPNKIECKSDRCE